MHAVATGTFFLLISCSVVPPTQSLSEATLYRLAQASSLSYLSIDRIPSSRYFQSCQLKPIIQAVDPNSASGATIFLDSSSVNSSGKRLRNLVVACRGSANLKNFGTNLKYTPVPVTRLPQCDIPDDARVHEGFLDASLGLWRVLERHLRSVLKEKEEALTASQFDSIVFAGHSLGAATALLCSIYYRSSSWSEYLPNPTLISFGGPRLCNDSFARYVRNVALEGCTILHLVHEKDPVLANNQRLWDSLGYRHVGIELTCDPKLPRLIIHNNQAEEIHNHESFHLLEKFAWNIVDHCYYMGVYMGPRIVSY